VAHVLEQSGMEVRAGDVRFCEEVDTADCDLLVAGSPVNYCDLPPNVRGWFRAMRPLDRAAVAAYSTFGGHGDNQHNTAQALLMLMVNKGGVPAGMATFGNMSTYAPTWSMGNEERTLRYAHLPNAETYARVETFARSLLEAVRAGRVHRPEREFDLADWSRHLPMVGTCKLLTTAHHVDQDKCIGCGTCYRGCPVGAIDPGTLLVNTRQCLLCLGCVNNCPQGAVNMKFMGRKVYGFSAFLRQRGIVLLEPDIPGVDPAMEMPPGNGPAGKGR
jgi:ferredoxin